MLRRLAQQPRRVAVRVAHDLSAGGVRRRSPDPRELQCASVDEDRVPTRVLQDHRIVRRRRAERGVHRIPLDHRAPAVVPTSPGASRGRRSMRPVALTRGFPTLATISSQVRAVVRSSCRFDSPSPMKCPWPSMSPGTASRPFRSITRVDGPTSFRISSFVPTARIRSPAIAIASRFRLRRVHRDDVPTDQRERRGLRAGGARGEHQTGEQPTNPDVHRIPFIFHRLDCITSLCSRAA